MALARLGGKVMMIGAVGSGRGRYKP
ncbi:hypothetical protein [Biomaibacter acetigenes]